MRISCPGDWLLWGLARLLILPLAKQPVLPSYPFADLAKEAFRAEDADNGAEGKDVDKQLRLIGQIVVDGADPGIRLFLKRGVFFVIGKMEHTPFQGIALPADFHYYRVFAAADGAEGVSVQIDRRIFPGKMAAVDAAYV